MDPHGSNPHCSSVNCILKKSVEFEFSLQFPVGQSSGYRASYYRSHRVKGYPLAKIHKWLVNTESTQVSVSFSHPPVRNSSQGIMKANRYSVCLHDMWWEWRHHDGDADGSSLPLVQAGTAVTWQLRAAALSQLPSSTRRFHTHPWESQALCSYNLFVSSTKLS